MDVRIKVAEEISKAGPQVEQILVENLVTSEVKRRVALVSMALDKLTTLEKDHKKIDRNDIVTFVSGNKTESMSEKRYSEIQKSNQSITQLRETINSALEKNDEQSYTKLDGLCKQNNSGSPEKAETKA